MNRIFAIVLVCLTTAPAMAGGYTYSNGYYWKGGQAYSRYVYPNCYSSTGYSYGYKAASVVKTYPVTNNNNSKTYTYNISYSQPAAQQGSTLYGTPSFSLQSYGSLDLGATVDGLLRLSTDTQQGAVRVAGEARALAGEVAAYASQQNQAALAIAEYQAQAELLRAAKPNPQLNLQYDSGGGHGGGGEFQSPRQGSDGWGPLVTQYCANCHGQGGANEDSFSLQDMLSFEGYLTAQSRITHDDPSLRMPKGVNIDPNTRGAILNELSASISTFLRSQ